MFKQLGQLGNLASMMKQAQQMTSRMQELNDELRGQRVEGSSGGGMVRVEANGVGEVLKVSLDPDLVARADREMLEDLLPAAINDAQAQAKQLHADAMKSITSGMDVPGLDEAISNITGGENGA